MEQSTRAKAIMAFLKPRLGARIKSWMEICAHCGQCADTCHFYLAADRDPKMIPSAKVNWLIDIIRRKGEVDDEYLKQVYSTIYHECNMCRRCTQFCPFGINIADMIALTRALLFHVGICPEAIRNTIGNYHATGNQMGVTDEDWVDTLEWCQEEMESEVEGLVIPIDKQGARIMYTINAREAKFYPQDIQEAAKIFHVAGESWTLPSKPGWDDTNLAMFVGDTATAKTIVENIFKRADELGVDKVAITECGHAYRAVKFEAPTWLGAKPRAEVIHAVELYHDYLANGTIKLKHKIKEPTTVQDPCNQVRSGGLSEKLRRLSEMVSEDFRPMENQGNYNFCCGGGGGAIPMGGEMRAHRMKSGKIKAEQIRATGAKIVLVPCHNCIDQIRDLNKEYDLGIKAVHFKEVIAHNMIIPEHMIPKEEGEEEA